MVRDKDLGKAGERLLEAEKPFRAICHSLESIWPEKEEEEGKEDIWKAS